MKLILANDDGVVLAQWSIGHKYEFNIEDLDAEPKHDFYTVDMILASSERDIGQGIAKEILIFEKRGEI